MPNNRYSAEETQLILEHLVKTAKQAGQAILQVYQKSNFEIETKQDNSPVTAADLAAHVIIVEQLQNLYPEIPCLSEESEGITFAQRREWEQYFIIDPLDGTKEFIARNDDFTVNIALVINGEPVMGVIHAPVFNTTYYAANEYGAFKQTADKPPIKIKVRKIPSKYGEPHLTIINSRRHGLENVKKLCKNIASYQSESRGSSLKMCLIAEGKADFYPRLAPTSEWDTAAAQCIVEQAGGKLCQLDLTPLVYNQKESLLNPFFLVLGDQSFDWKDQLNLKDTSV